MGPRKNRQRQCHGRRRWSTRQRSSKKPRLARLWTNPLDRLRHRPRLKPNSVCLVSRPPPRHVQSKSRCRRSNGTQPRLQHYRHQWRRAHRDWPGPDPRTRPSDLLRRQPRSSAVDQSHVLESQHTLDRRRHSRNQRRRQSISPARRSLLRMCNDRKRLPLDLIALQLPAAQTRRYPTR